MGSCLCVLWLFSLWVCVFDLCLGCCVDLIFDLQFLYLIDWWVCILCLFGVGWFLRLLICFGYWCLLGCCVWGLICLCGYLVCIYCELGLVLIGEVGVVLIALVTNCVFVVVRFAWWVLFVLFGVGLVFFRVCWVETWFV